MPEKLSDAAYYTTEDERQRKIARYRMNVWELFKEQVAITDDMRVDPPYRQNLVMLKRLAGALIVKLNDEGALETLKGQIKEHYLASQVERVTKALELLFEEACKECITKESEVRSYLRSVQPGGKL
jgi:hypothetical protein